VQHRDLLLGGEAAEEVIGSLAERQSRVAVANRFDGYPSQAWLGRRAAIPAGRKLRGRMSGKSSVYRLLRSGQCEIYPPAKPVKRFDS
jgi:hypothetical protein